MLPQPIILKQESQTDEKYGCAPEKRKIEDYVKNGIINLDKPSGPTSHEVAAWVRNIFSSFGVTKAGHSGTLDPNVTGVLPMAIQNSVKIIPALIRAPKEYVAIMHLHKPVSEGVIRAAFKKFTGEIEQMPPKLSGVKKQLRKRHIYYLKILEIEEQNVLFRVGCEAGTYIRTLCVDFGKALGMGAHMQELRRTKAGTFQETDSVNLQSVKDAVEIYLENVEIHPENHAADHGKLFSKAEKGGETELRKVVLPVEYGVRHLEKIFIKDSAVSAVSNGAPLHAGGISKLTGGIEPDGMVAIMTLKEELVALGCAQMSSGQMLKSEKGIAAKINRVLMPAGIYPREW